MRRHRGTDSPPLRPGPGSVPGARRAPTPSTASGRLLRLGPAVATGALPWDRAFRPAAPYLAAPTDPSLARLPLVTEGPLSLKHSLWGTVFGAQAQSRGIRVSPGCIRI